MGYDWLVVGAGFAGSVLAERLASRPGQRVLVIDRRDHIGGNAFDEPDGAGGLVHRYGPHIFHTNAASVVEYLSRFTDWRPYEHRVLACVRDRLVPIPINRTTINALYGLGLSDEAAVERFLAGRAEPREPARTSEDVVVGRVGRELYELFFRGYTRKQWGLDPSQLDASVTARVPTRANDDDRYFTDRYQLMPLDGYTAMFRRMLDRPGIEVRTGTSWADVRSREDYARVVFTGPVDEYFDHRFGRLPYRSLRFEHERLDGRRVLPVGTVNYPDEAVPYTRITEFGHLTGRWGRPPPGGGGRPDDPRPRVPDRRRRPLLPHPEAPERRAVPALRGPRRGRSPGGLRWPPGHVPLLQHGPGRRPGTEHASTHRGRRGAGRVTAAARGSGA